MRTLGLILLVGGAIAAYLGFSFTGGHDFESWMGKMFGSGATSEEFELAAWGGPVGAAVAIAGLVMLLGGKKS
jgi:hypothetical protein